VPGVIGSLDRRDGANAKPPARSPPDRATALWAGCNGRLAACNAQGHRLGRAALRAKAKQASRRDGTTAAQPTDAAKRYRGSSTGHVANGGRARLHRTAA